MIPSLQELHLYKPDKHHSTPTLQNPKRFTPQEHLHLLQFPYKTGEPSNALAGDYSGRYVFGYNSPAAISRELFKPSADAASLLDSIKIFFVIWVKGSPGRSSQSGGVFEFLTNFHWPWTPSQCAKILAQTFLGRYIHVFWIEIYSCLLNEYMSRKQATEKMK